jgi:L-threonylcarbamoyladenylate synthase
MSCEILTVSATSPDPAAIERAAAILRAGGLVAFPTETVYGLGAHALDAAAVARIFSAKGRPAANPLIVHVPNMEAARSLVAEWPAQAQQLTDRFWPGPLTLVLPRRPIVPDIVTAGGPTVAVRVPAHPVALALLRAAGLPLAAPSANRSTQLSPTRADHVLRSLSDRIDLLLDAGPTAGGLESTVLDLTHRLPHLLRPGLVTLRDLESGIGPVVVPTGSAEADAARSPGQMPRHYAPRTPLDLAADIDSERIRTLLSQKQRVGLVTLDNPRYASPEGAVIVRMSDDPAAYAARLYAVLHELDALGLDRIVVELPPATDEWRAIHDRLRRAATND